MTKGIGFAVRRERAAVKKSIVLVGILLLVTLASCESMRTPEREFGALTNPSRADQNIKIEGGELLPKDQPLPGETGQDLNEPLLFKGSDQFVKPPAGGAHEVGTQGDIVLNFENVGLRDVVREILGNILKVNYLYDPRVDGTVSLQTARPLPRDAVMPTLEMILRQNGAALVKYDGVYRVIPAEEAVRSQVSPMLGSGGAPIRAGYGVIIVPLRYISAVQMSRILDPLLPAEGVLRVDIDRNLLILAGTSPELRSLKEVIDIFDVDWLSGMSTGLFPLMNVSAETVAEELEKVFGDQAEGPLAGLVRFVPIQRLNALLVITQRSEYLDRAQTWIERLDQGAEAGIGLYVYYVQNGRAADLASTLNQIFGNPEETSAAPRARVAPGQQPVTLRSTPTPPVGAAAPATPRPAPPAQRPNAPASAGRASEGLAFSAGVNIRIIADEINNALLILAAPRDYRMVQAALRKLDIVPLQVLIDATVADVTLNNDLRYGVQHFLSRGNNTITLSTASSGTVSSTFPGFSYSFVNGDSAVVLDALEGVTKVQIKSSPRLMVLDNQTARLQVGDEVPVITQQQQSTRDTANIINSIQFRETGVILEVTPRVNSGGLVTLDIQTEVSNVSESVKTGVLTPTISQRKIKSSIAVQNGQTVILGGLVQENATESRSGLPVLSRIPVLGALFGNVQKSLRGTELIILLTPRVVRNPADAQAITNEIRRQMRSFAPVDDSDGSKGISSQR